MLDQRRRRWAGVVQMLYKCFVFAGILRLDTAFLYFHGSMIVLDGIVWVALFGGGSLSGWNMASVFFGSDGPGRPTGL